MRMDPLAHTLVGAALAETGLRRASPLATATLILGANAPDLDAVVSVAGTDASLFWRRGLTHGVVAMVVLPLAVTGVLLAWDRLARRRRRPDAEPARGGTLLGLAFLAVLTHPALDWLNTYGVRLLMPFDGRWFYGDALFIVDPWLWLLAAAPVVAARARGRAGATLFTLLACATSVPVLLVDLVPAAAKVAWVVGIALVVAARRLAPERLAAACLAALALYIVAMLVAQRAARADVEAWLADRGLPATELVAAPLPADPFRRDVIARVGDRYHRIERAWLAEPFRETQPPVPIGPRDAVARAALAAPSIRGMSRWLRLPSVTIERDGDGHIVTIRDLRYTRDGARIGKAVVRLDAALHPAPTGGRGEP
jgi:inner membrane protein